MLDLLDDAQEHGVSACYSEDLFHFPVFGEMTYFDLYQDASPIRIPDDVRERVASIFSRLIKWQDLDLPWPPAFEVKIDGKPEESAPSIAWAHARAIEDIARAVACLVLPAGRIAGSFLVSVDDEVRTLWFVTDSQTYRSFFRWLIVETTRNPAEMQLLANPAFPELDFVQGAFNGIRDMSKPYHELVDSIVRHLGAFSDHGRRIFSGQWQHVEAEFGPLGVDISDENGNTKRDSNARKKHIRRVDGTDIIFWWHSKLERDRDRIHIYPDRILTGGRLLVGIFCYHL